jgi:RNA polymerase sigma factor (sigma-70 family)
MDELPDEALLAGLAAGDTGATVAFVRRFQAKVFGVALAVTGDRTTAEDVAQQAFVKAWRRADTFDPVRGSVSAWITAIARNLAIDATRVRTPIPVQTIFEQVVSTSRQEAAVDGYGLREALRSLPVEQARAVVLSGVAGMSASQVAVAEGIPLGTAKTRIRTGMRRLRQEMVGVADG